MEFSEYLDSIELKLAESFDIERDYGINGFKYDLFAEHHMRTEQYIITKKTVINSIETNEFCFIKYFDHIDEREVETFTGSIIDAIDKVINFDDGHMSSIMTAVIVVEDKPNAAIIKMIEKYKYQKGFAFGFKGWVDIRLLLVTMKDKYIVSNKKGKEVMEVYSI